MRMEGVSRTSIVHRRLLIVPTITNVYAANAAVRDLLAIVHVVCVEMLLVVLRRRVLDHSADARAKHSDVSEELENVHIRKGKVDHSIENLCFCIER